MYRDIFMDDVQCSGSRFKIKVLLEVMAWVSLNKRG